MKSISPVARTTSHGDQTKDISDDLYDGSASGPRGSYLVVNPSHSMHRECGHRNDRSLNVNEIEPLNIYRAHNIQAHLIIAIRQILRGQLCKQRHALQDAQMGVVISRVQPISGFLHKLGSGRWLSSLLRVGVIGRNTMMGSSNATSFFERLWLNGKRERILDEQSALWL
ncbi:uncharacterized protein MYCGRDRAFT_96252 [Zymoseptoria tritici IPO323]|uniref:Uncharacterized protein n=1 Tax=Zymoseptoria tritici (strain CBS 115943 / IPO323) TaxID=336722 RepID=F9XL72_ZYMTI|nr:uncharacterized protein MYCGRDRAFT_96252 [Zymoseptoria tritici IPO323]EGP83866.1 hypothetical protein MYCGRDRAFT_96252 [Zymoseptoria tritici IPO323]